MDIDSLIDNIDLILHYFLPGYLYIRTKNYCLDKVTDIDNIGRVFDAIFISIIIEKLFIIIIKLPKGLGFTSCTIKLLGKHDEILALSLISIMFGYFTSREDIYEIKYKLFKKLKIKENIKDFNDV